MNLGKTYDKSRENEIYQNWLEKGYFKASAEEGVKNKKLLILL